MPNVPRSLSLLGCKFKAVPDIKVHGAIMGPIWGRQDPGGPHVGPMNHAIRLCASRTKLLSARIRVDNYPLEYLIKFSSSMELKLYPADI